MIAIWWRNTNGIVEKIDAAENENEARYLVREYKLAFHSNQVWSGRKKDEMNQMKENNGTSQKTRC